MKNYIRPRAEVFVFSQEVLMASDENETPKDHVELDGLTVGSIENI